MDVSVTVVPFVPLAVAVLGFVPSTAAIGPRIQVASWLFAASATGKVIGAAPSTVPSPSTHEQEAVLTLGSLTLTEFNGRSPTFSTMSR